VALVLAGSAITIPAIAPSNRIDNRQSAFEMGIIEITKSEMRKLSHFLTCATVEPRKIILSTKNTKPVLSLAEGSTKIFKEISRHL
jgi:hypothetical protein